MSSYKATRSMMGDMTNGLERDPQLKSVLDIRKKQIGVEMDFDSGMRLGYQLTLRNGFARGRGNIRLQVDRISTKGAQDVDQKKHRKGCSGKYASLWPRIMEVTEPP
ncbi:MAG: hypothetical protein QM684_18505 [Rhizobium sp.]